MTNDNNNNNTDNQNNNEHPSAQDYRRMGNEHFAAKQFDVALTLYSQAIMEACNKDDPNSNSTMTTTDDAEDAVNLILHYCNRSACLLAMCMSMSADPDLYLHMCASAVSSMDAQNNMNHQNHSTSANASSILSITSSSSNDELELLSAEKATEDARTAWNLCLGLHDPANNSNNVENEYYIAEEDDEDVDQHDSQQRNEYELCHVTAKSAFRLSKGLLTCIGLCTYTYACIDDYDVSAKQSEALSVLQSALDFLSQQSETVQQKCENYIQHLSKIRAQMDRDISLICADQKSQLANIKSKSKSKEVGAKDFEMCDELGTGNFSQVVVARHKITKVQYALKIIEKKKAEQLAKRQHPNVYNEIQMERRALLEKLAKPSRHPFVIRMHAAFQDYYSLYYLMDLHHDLAQGPNMHAELWEANRFKGFSVGAHYSLVPVYIAEVLEAIQFCHTRGIVHRDLKPENVLIQENGHICLIDFGTAKDLNDTDLNGPEFVGTPEYMSPEAVKGGTKDEDMPCGYAMDYWALGVMMYNLHIGVTSFCSPSPYLAFLKIRRGIVPHPDCLPDDAWDLIQQLLVMKPRDRLGSKEGDVEAIRKHPFFQNCDHTENQVGKLCEKPAGVRVPSLVDLCVRVAADKIKNDAMKFDEDEKEPSESYKRALATLQLPVDGAEDALNNGEALQRAMLLRRQLHIRARIMHVLERMFCLGNVRIRRVFYSSKADMRLKRVRTGTKDCLGMSYSDQRHDMRQRQQELEAKPGEEHDQLQLSFVILTSPLFSDNSFDSKTKDQHLADLKVKIRTINRSRPRFVLVNALKKVDDASRKLLGKISETIPTVVNDGSLSNCFSVFPPQGSLVHGIMLHLKFNADHNPILDDESLLYVKQEMEANSMSQSPTFVAVNIDPRKLPGRLLRRLRYGKIMFVIGPNDDNNDYSNDANIGCCAMEEEWKPLDGSGTKDEYDSDLNSLCGDEEKNEDSDAEEDQGSKEKKSLKMIRSNSTLVYRIYEEDMRWSIEQIA